MTNREWLNSLSDEDYAKFETMMSWCDVCCNSDEVHAHSCDEKCAEHIVKWLREERSAYQDYWIGGNK